ncbi:MAG: cysteine hydrolase [Chloroflexota bacterium]
MAEQLALDRKTTTVLVMDYQNRQLSYFTEAFRNEIVARAKRVLAKAREKGIPIIHVEVLRGERTPETAIHPAMVPPPGELLLTKHRTGPFSTTNLDEVLKKQGTTTLVMLGLRTAGCILLAVRWAADIDYKLIVLSDCCADQDEELHRVLMGKVLPMQAKVITAEEFLKALEAV